MFRKIVFWVHLITGLLSGIFIFILCLTGAILAFEIQLVDWSERDARAARVGTAELLAPDVLVEKAKQDGERITGLQWFADPGMPVRLQTDKRTFILLNGYTGEVLGRGSPNLRAFMKFNTELHTTLTASPEVGGWIMGVANAGFVFLIVSGFYLWWPKHWRWNALRNSIALRFDIRGKAQDWNWHNALGFWFFLPLLFIATTGLVLSFKSVDQWWRSYGGNTVLGPSAKSVKLDAGDGTATTFPQWLKFVQEQNPDWRSVRLNGEGKPNKEGVLSFSVDLGTPRQGPFVKNVKLDTKIGKIVETSGWSSGDGSARARSIARLGHTGEFFGSFGQFIGLLACLAGLVLVYTGFALSWRRFFPSRKAIADAETPQIP